MKFKSAFRNSRPGMFAVTLVFAISIGHASEQEKIPPSCESAYLHVMHMHEMYMNQALVQDAIERDKAAAAVADYLSSPAWLQNHRPKVYRF